MIKERVLEGLPLNDVFVFDIHGHLGKNNQMQHPASDAENIIATMDRLGINSMCVSSIEALNTHPDFGNSFIQTITEKYSGRFYGYVAATPHDKNYRFEKFFSKYSNMLGIKIHATMNQTTLSNLGYLPYLEFANSKQIPILFHTWIAEEVRQAAFWAENFRNCPIILAHAGLTDYAAQQEVISSIKKYENIYIDTAISSTYDGALEWIVKQVGADRVLYGSDAVFFDCRHTFGRVALSRISDIDKCKILGNNALRLFSIQIPKEKE